MSPRLQPLAPRRTPDKPAITGFLTHRDVGKLRHSDSLAPGAWAALQRGCRCGAARNCYGRGTGDERWPVYEVAHECPLHGATAQERGA